MLVTPVANVGRSLCRACLPCNLLTRSLPVYRDESVSLSKMLPYCFVDLVAIAVCAQ